MPKSITSKRHQLLAAELGAKRRGAGLTQAEVAARMGHHQPFIANIESGQRRVDVVEFLDLAEIIGLDVSTMLAKLRKAR